MVVRFVRLVYGEVVATTLNYAEDEEIVTVEATTLYGYELRPESCVISHWTEDDPSFAQIRCVSLLKRC